MAATRTSKAIRPAQLRKVILTRFFRRKTGLEFHKSSGIVFHTPIYYKLWLHQLSGYPKRIIEEVEGLYGEKISRETVRRIVNEKKSQVVVEAEETESESKEKDRAIVEKSKEVMVRHGGALIALPILDKYNVNEMIINGSGEASRGYSFYECVLSIAVLTHV